MVNSKIRSKQQDNVLEAAEKCFIEKGIALTTMTDIAKEANIYRRTLYNYFQSKEEIAYVIHETYISDTFNFEMSSSKNGYELLVEQIDDLTINLEKYLPYIRFTIQYEFYFNKITDNADKLKSTINTKFVETLRKILIRGVFDGSIYLPEGDIEMIVQSIIQTLVGYIQRVIHREEVFIMESNFSKKEIHHVFKILLRGLKA